VAEIIPDSTTYTSTASLPAHGYVAMAAVGLWVTTGAVTIADITDQFPRGLVFAAGALAITVTLLAAVMWLRATAGARTAELARDIAALTRTTLSLTNAVQSLETRTTEALGHLAAQQE
jgi:hypothetical protein